VIYDLYGKTFVLLFVCSIVQMFFCSIVQAKLTNTKTEKSGVLA